MKKITLLISCTVAILATTLLSSCASTPKEPRTMKLTSRTLQNDKKADAAIENWGLNVICDVRSSKDTVKIGRYISKSFIIATNTDKTETIVYSRFEKSAAEQIEFSYVELNGEKSSTMRIYMDAGTIILNNTDELCAFESGNYELRSDAYVPITKDMADIRSSVKDYIAEKYGIKCSEEINSVQKEKTGINK